MQRIAPLGIFIFLLAACDERVEEKAADFQFYDEPVYIPLDTTAGYTIHPLLQDTVQPVVLLSGDTIASGIHLESAGKTVHPDSIQPPVRIKAGPPIITAANENIHWVPKDLPQIPLNENAVLKTEFGKGNQTPVVLNTAGDTVVPGLAVNTSGKTLNMRIKKSAASDLQLKDAANYDIRFLDVDQGLSSSYLFDMFQDSRGTIWFGTYGLGAAAFDGETFTYFSTNEGFPDEEVVSFLEDKQGNIWLGSYGAGVVRYDGQTFTHYNEQNGLTGDVAFDMAVDQNGNIWMATLTSGVVRFEPDASGTDGIFTTFTTASGLNHNSVTSVFSDSKGNLWLGTDGGGVGKLEFSGGSEKSFTWYTTACGLPDDHVWYIEEAADGVMWFGTTNGICRFDGNAFTHLTQNEGLSHNRVRSLKVASDNILWIGTSDGLNRFDGESFTQYKTENGLTHNRLSGIIEDRAHNIWFGTWGGGACRLNPQGFTNYYERHGLPSCVVFTTIEEPDGNFWFGSIAGMSHYDGKQFATYTPDQGLVDLYIRKIYRDQNGHLWIAGFDKGLSVFDGTYFTNYTPENGLSGQRVSTILEDSKGRFWFGTWDNGVTVLEGETWKHYTTANGLSDDQVLVIMEDRNGVIWIGSDGGGLTRFDENSASAGQTGFTHFTEQEGLPSNRVFSIVEDHSGNLWIGFDGAGVCIFDGKGFTHYGVKQGLVNGKVRSVLEDKKGNVWVGTDGGMTCFIPDSSAKTDTGIPAYKRFSYVSKDGLKGIDFNTNSAFIDSKNTAWWGTGKALTTYNLNHDLIAAEKPVMGLRSLNINGAQVDFRDTSDQQIRDLKHNGITAFENYPVNLILPYTQNHLTFHFSAMDWQAPEKLKYSYRLVGLDDDWSIPATDAKADYHGLPHGRYSFQVKAVGEAQVWSDSVTYSFSILPPWWHTWWFRALLAVLAAAVIYLLIRWRTTSLRKRQAELEKIVEERTIEVVREKKAVEDQKSLVEEKNKEILDSISYAKRLQEAILPSQDFVKKHLPDSFILYKPKDIVAGDFYWMETVGETVLFAVADCTGHGVPGALVSVVCSNALNQAVREFGITEPAQILNKVRDLVIQTFEKSSSEVKDGMDISLCSLVRRSDSEGGLTLNWAGANNALWIIRKNDTNTEDTKADLSTGNTKVKQNDAHLIEVKPDLSAETESTNAKGNGIQLIEVKADKQPIGKYHNPKPFSNHSLKLQQGDKIYLFSDGYQDQFGGAKSKKFKASRLKELLLESYSVSMKDQRILLENTFENWRGELEQLDDVCIAGVQI